MLPDGRARVVIENVKPEIDGGKFPAKRVVGEKVRVQADIFADGHDSVAAQLLFKGPRDNRWKEMRMRFLENDQWEGEFIVEELGIYRFTIKGWVNYFRCWQKDLQKKFEAGMDVKIDMRIGVQYIQETIDQAAPAAESALLKRYGLLREKINSHTADAVLLALSEELSELMEEHAGKKFVVTYHKELEVVVDPPKALFSTWYEFFPRSCPSRENQHGTFKDAEKIIPEIARMGFDVIYLPPIHPIGKTNRKGKNNSPASGPEDVGSPWAIGSEEGGYKAIHPSLGTFEDFENFVLNAKQQGIEVALDIAFQCSPDHPYVREHPEWFRMRPDGTIQYAENPPKKYEDIFPLNFETQNWKELWVELKSVVLFWIEKGIRIFRVDNPHTKSFHFWEWLVKEIKKDYPEVFFLSEAFTRPKIMYYLAKIGFSQSYTYFTWRYTQREFKEYLIELTRSEVKEFFRSNFWPNTPDILPEHLQYGGRPAFIMRLILAATLSSNYGIYGPAFELCLNEALPGKEEYRDSEKYEIKQWDWDKQGNLKDLISRVNKIRRENPALQTPWNLSFYEVDNENLLFYGKVTEDLLNIIFIVINLDPFHTHSGWVNVPVKELDIDAQQPYLVHDLLSDDKYIWQGERNYVELNPQILPAKIFRVRKKLKREMDFDYFM